MVRPTPPPPESADKQALDELADKMLSEAASVLDARVYSATGFARENISILHQQIRCANLAWALTWKGRVAAGDVVAIAGGSFSALTLAVALSLTTDAIIYILEKEDRLLSRFLDKGHRHLSPVLNSRSLGKGFDPSSSSPEFRSPIFAWEAGRASDVASVWLREFADYERRLPIFVFTRCEVKPGSLQFDGERLRIDLSEEELPDRPILEVDLLIDATGFGAEVNPLGLPDYSYWEAGHRLIYDHLPQGARVLISGCGDSGVIEALHYALAGFQHRDVEALWPPFSGVDAQLDEGVARARLDGLLKNADVDARDGLSELCWWLDMWRNLELNAFHDWLNADPHTKPIFEVIEAALTPALRQAFPDRASRQISWKDREAFLEGLALEDQFSVREAVRPVADQWISRRLAEFAETLPVNDLVEALTAMIRPGVQVVLNGLTPTAYTRQLSPYNVWVMRALLSLPNVSYRPGSISRVSRRPRSGYDVAFANGRVGRFDRVVTRYGPGGGAGIAQCGFRDTQAGDWLLADTDYVVRGADAPNRHRRVWAARESLLCGLDYLLGARARPPDGDISKRLYVERMLTKQSLWPEDHDLYSDPQARLSDSLRRGTRPTFETDGLVMRALKR